MLNQNFFGLSLTTWIVIIIILIYSIYLTKCDMENFSANSDIEDNSDFEDNSNFEDNSDVDSTVKVYNFNTRCSSDTLNNFNQLGMHLVKK